MKDYLSREEAEKAADIFLKELTDDYCYDFASKCFLSFPRCEWCGQSVPTDTEWGGGIALTCSHECSNKLGLVDSGVRRKKHLKDKERYE